jgi:hypothetical protein
LDYFGILLEQYTLGFKNLGGDLDYFVIFMKLNCSASRSIYIHKLLFAVRPSLCFFVYLLLASYRKTKNLE